MSDVGRRIADNLAGVRDRIAAAAERAARPAEAITLVGVTKYVSAEIAAELVAAGCNQLGESRPQELWSKALALADKPVAWHLIGHLQRNKIRRTLPLVYLFHSIDSPRVLAAINDEAALAGLTASVLIEVNISADASKTGLAAGDVEPLLVQAGSYPHVAIRGLMGMASLEGGQAAAERDFAALRALRDRLAANLPPGISLPELSMGMSDDFEIAIAHGATIVRVGSALFAGLER